MLEETKNLTYLCKSGQRQKKRNVGWACITQPSNMAVLRDSRTGIVKDTGRGGSRATGLVMKRVDVKMKCSRKPSQIDS